MSFYNRRDWYWFVGSNKAQVYSSARGAYVPATDAAYQQWLAGGKWTSTIANEAELLEVLVGVVTAIKPATS